jgi:hypothetical protein
MRREVVILPAFLLLIVTVLWAGPDGRYAGTWTSDAGVNSGKLSMTISPMTGEKWPTDLVFTFQDQPIKPVKVTTTIADDHMLIVADEEIDGYKLKSTFNGTLKGNVIEGKYKTTVAEEGSQVDSGAWKLTQQ